MSRVGPVVVDEPAHDLGGFSLGGLDPGLGVELGQYAGALVDGEGRQSSCGLPQFVVVKVHRRHVKMLMDDCQVGAAVTYA